VTHPTEGQDESAWTRLRRRKVGQWGIAYVAGAWGLLQGIGFAADAFHWPDAIKQVALLLLLLGLPVVVILAWYHGDKGQQRVTRTELAILTVLFLVGGGLFWRYEYSSQSTSSTTAKTVRALAPGAAADAHPSIAVLPFENRSDEHKDAFFVDGIHDDILTQLSKISALKVISRTSVEQFRNTKLPTKTIAAQLGVTKVLEGGVQRAGDRVRINVQLIDAGTDAHLWAETYDRELTAENIFAIQTELAAAIAGALKAALTPAEKKRASVVPTRNLDAWEAYQVGRQRMSKRTSRDLTEAEGFFQKAIDLDPKFALAYAGLADSIWLKADYSGQPFVPAMAKAEEILGHALRLDPNLAEAITTLAKFAQERRDFERAEAAYRRAIEINPNYPTAHQWYAQLLALQGRDAEALQSMQRAVELDPLSPILQANLAWGLSGAGRFNDALAAFNKIRDIDPLSPLPYIGIGTVHATAFGRLDNAVQFIKKAIELDVSGTSHVTQLAQIYLDLGDEAEASRWLARATRATGDASANAVRAYLRLYRGERPKVVALAQRAVETDARDWRALALLRNADLQANDVKAARSRYERAFPELFTQQPRAIDPSNYNAAIDLAVVLQRNGEREHTGRLLDRIEALIGTFPRLGPFGFTLSDVQIHALRGDKAKALAALREAERAGWRGPFWRYYRDFDLALASIRNEPEFKAVFVDIERDIARQRAELAARPEDAPLDLGEPAK
jgi:TolB-like protein/Tfp pilus assembly protein PilF